MDEKQSTPPLKKPKRRWFRRFLIVVAGFILLIAIFHRWIVFGLVKIGVGYAEKAGKMQIAYQLDGTIFTSLTLSDVKIRVLEPGPLEKLTLGRLALRYHPWDAWRNGLPALVESIEVRDLDLTLDGTFPSKPKPKKAKKKSSGGGISIPFPQLVDIRGINLTIKTPTEPLEVKNANFTLLPTGPGVLSVDRLAIPNYRTFENLHGHTSYANRNLILQNLAIEKNLIIEKLQVDASKIGNDQLSALLVAQTFGGKIDIDFAIRNLSDTGDLTLSLASQKIDLTQAIAFAAPPVDPTPAPAPPDPNAPPSAQKPPTPDTAPGKGIVNELNLRIEGQAADLTTWNGTLRLDTSNLLAGTTVLDRGTVQATITNGRVKFNDTVFSKGDQKIALSGTAQLPGKNPQTNPLLADIVLAADVPDLSVFLPSATGAAKLNLALNSSPTRLSANLTAEVNTLAMNTLGLTKTQVTAQFTKTDPTVIDWKKPWWTNTNLSADIAASALQVSGYQIDRVAAKIRSSNENAKIETVEIVRGSNAIRATGDFTFQEKPAGPLPGALVLALKIDTPVLTEFSLDPAAPIIEGRAQGNADIRWSEKNPVADLRLEVSDLVHQGVALGQLTLAAHVENGLARLNNLLLDLPGESFVQASGDFDLEKADRYSGQVSTLVTDLSQFKPLMGPSAAATPLAGTIHLDWNGTGQLKERLHEGRLALFMKDGVYAGVTAINLKTSGYYTPKDVDFPDINLSTSKGSLTTAIRYADKVLQIANLRLAQGPEVRLAGNISLPLDIEQIANSEKRLPLDAPIQIDLAGKNVNIGSLLTDLGMVPPATGFIGLSINAKGTLRNLDATIALAADNLESEKAKQLQPITARINLGIGNQRAQLSGEIKEASIQPIALSGSIPLELVSIISTGSISPDLPIAAKVTLPPSDLAFVNRYVSVMDSIQGKAGLDVSVEGTLKKPRFLGNVTTNISSIRFRGDTIPDVKNMQVALAFRENVLTFDQFKADLAGGPVALTGKIDLTKPAEPIFDISLNGKSILVTRNDNMIVRADLALALKGPLAAAELTGNIGVTDSRFFRDIDILPLNLPGRPAPAIQDKRSAISVTAAPVRDWKFNVNIKTADAFKITGNLANGEVVMDLNLGGTGLAPTLDGYVRVSELKASLPFSTLTINDGNIYFSKDLPLLSPVLDMTGKSQVRDYDITAYIYGDLVKPQTLFLSQPPLSQEDILTLIATGVTRSEIQENPQLLAGRAGYLFVQKYYNKIFKKKRGADDANSFADRFDLQIGNVDPKTGRENVSARFKLTDRYRIIFDLDLTGGVRGQVRYLIRFK